MNVLLINPPSFNELMGNNPAIIESERGYNPPLGLLMLAGYLLEKNPKHPVTVIDAQVEELSYKQLEKRVGEISFDVVGITAMTFTLIDVKLTIQLLKRGSPSCIIVLGGPHVNLYPEETMAITGVDFLVIGEGELIFSDLLDHIDDKEKLINIKGLVFKDQKGDIVHTGIPDTIEEQVLDTLPFPARHLTPYKKYSSLLAKRTPITTIFTSRGCPFACSFCNRPHLGKQFRALSPERVVAEFENCLKLGIHEFLIYDDTFTIGKDRVKDICRIVIDRKLDIGFDIRARVDTLDEEMLKLLKKAGCRGIHYGIEAGTPKILKVLKKGIDLDKAKQMFELTRKHKIQTLAYFMIGAPTETLEDIEETFRVAKWLNPDYVHMTILTPFPGTPIYQDGLASNQIKTDYWRQFARTVDPAFQPPHWDEIFTHDQLEKLIVRGYKEFYTRPMFMLKKFFSIRSFGEFKRKASAGLKVIFMKKAR